MSADRRILNLGYSASRECGKSRPVTAMDAAKALIDEIISDHGPVLFHMSGGCCDGSSPMCYAISDFIIGDSDVRLGEIDGTPVYMGGAQHAAWPAASIVIDAVAGRGGMFSLDNGRERRLLSRSLVRGD